jgi:hypothetical protein
VGKVQGAASEGAPEFQANKERMEWGRGPWRAVLAFCPGAPEFQVTPLLVIITARCISKSYDDEVCLDTFSCMYSK